jgi:hypothetical protein
LEEFADLGAFVTLAPTPQERIQLRNQLCSARISGGSANDSRLRSGLHDPEGAGSMTTFFVRFVSSTAFSIWQPERKQQTLDDKPI